MGGWRRASAGRRWQGTAAAVVAAVLAVPAAGAVAAAPDDLLPPPVAVRPEPEGVTLVDPAFEPVLGARADHGRLGGSVYQVEVPRDWNGRLVLYQHGYGELGSETSAAPPDFRTYLIARGYAWGASSFSSSSLIPGRAADETAALWDYFARTYGRPARTYIMGLSMGGMATHVAAERYPDRYDGALALCGAAGMVPAVSIGADFFAAAAYVAGVTQAEYDAATDIGALIRDRIQPALRDRAAHRRFEDIVLDLTGGPRAYGREGLHMEEGTIWHRVELSVAAGIAPNRDTQYRLGELSGVDSDEFNREVVRLRTNDVGLAGFVAGGVLTGQLRMPLLTMHSTGDGQVPIEQARILRQTVDAAGARDLLVQRVVRDPGHCGFRTTEQEAGFEALVDWVEHGKKPAWTDVLVDDLRHLDRTFELAPRSGSAEERSVPGVRDRAVVRGTATIDGEPLDADFLGAVVVRDGLVAPCQHSLPPVAGGRFAITVSADAEVHGCGVPGALVVLWTYVDGQQLYSREAVRWPGGGGATTFRARFSPSAPAGAAPPTVQFNGEVYAGGGRHARPGAPVDAFIGATRCGAGAVRRTGSYSGFIISVVGPDSIPGCRRDGTITFRVAGRRAAQTAENTPDAEGSIDLTPARGGP